MTNPADDSAARLDPQPLAFLQALETQGGPAVHTLTPTEARNLLLGIQTSEQVSKQPVAIDDRMINAGPTGAVSVRIVRPTGSTRRLPGVMYFHGGGWMLAKQRKGPKIDFQVLFYPMTDADLTTGSYQQFGEGGYWLSTRAMAWFWDNYVATDQRRQLTVSPLQASIEQLRGLPPALVITAENDLLRDEGEAYVHKLIEAGVVVTATRYLGTIHDFVMLNALSSTPAARAAIAQAAAALRNAFAR